MKQTKITLPLLIVLICCGFVGCDDRTQIQGYYSFYVPSSNYRVGQVWAIYTKPPKIDIELQSPISSEQTLISTDFSLSNEETSALVANASIGLKDQLSAKLGVTSSKSISQEYTNARVIEVEKSYLFESLKAYLEKNPSRASYLKSLLTTKPKRSLDVATHILIADITLIIEKSNISTAGADLPKILEGLDLDLSLTSTTGREYKFEGKALAVAYHSDPDFIKRCFDSLDL